jgi:hypothetical protein
MEVLSCKKGEWPIFQQNATRLEPVRLVPLGIGEKILLPDFVIGAIGDDRVIIPIDIGHRLWGL